MGHPRFSNEEIGLRGDAYYQHHLRAEVEPLNRGKYLVVDVETGDYEIGEEALELSQRLLKQRPEAALYALRIGYPATVRISSQWTGRSG